MVCRLLRHYGGVLLCSLAPVLTRCGVCMRVGIVLRCLGLLLLLLTVLPVLRRGGLSWGIVLLGHGSGGSLAVLGLPVRPCSSSAGVVVLPTVLPVSNHCCLLRLLLPVCSRLLPICCSRRCRLGSRRGLLVTHRNATGVNKGGRNSEV